MINSHGHALMILAAGSITLAGCAHTPAPGEVVTECGPLYQLRAKQIEPLKSSPGLATVYIETADDHENVADIQITLSSPTGSLHVGGSPGRSGFTDARGGLVAEWHAPDTSDGAQTTLTIQTHDFPGDCTVELAVTAER